MSTLTQFIKSPPKKRTGFYYVCGEVRRGVELVLRTIRSVVTPGDYRPYYLESDSFGDAFADLAIASNDSRMIVLRDAERLDAHQWEMIFRWVPKAGATRLVVITNEDNPRHGKFPQVFRWFAEAGKFVECRPFRTADQAVEFVSLFMQLPARYANMVVQKLGVDADLIISELEKAQLAAIPITDLSSVLSGGMPQDVLESLFTKDFKLNLSNVDLPMLLGLVELELVRQAAMQPMLEKHVPGYQIAQKLSIPAWAVGSTIERAKHTSAGQLANRLDLVLRTQQYLRIGADPVQLKPYFTTAWRGK